MGAWWAVNFAWGDALFLCASQRSADWFAAVHMPTYLYFFNYELLVIKLFDPLLGVFHASELLFVFDLKSYDGVPLPVRIDFDC